MHVAVAVHVAVPFDRARRLWTIQRGMLGPAPPAWTPFQTWNNTGGDGLTTAHNTQVMHVKPGSPCSLLDIAQGDVLVQVIP